MRQPRRRGVGDARRPDQPPQRLQPLEFGGASGAGAHVRLDGQGVRGVEFAVEHAMQHQRLVGTGDHARISSWQSAAASIRRARANRDITVPMGAPVTAATSR